MIRAPMPTVEPIHSPTIDPITAVEAAILRAEQVGDRVLQTQLEEYLSFCGREHPHELHGLWVYRLEAANHVDQRREETD